MDSIKNSVRLTGFAGADPVMVSFPGDKKMARLSLGVHEFYKNSMGETIDQTQWFNLLFWNHRVDLVANLVKKGSAVRVEGKLSTQMYTDKNGEKRYSTEIIVNHLEVIDKYDL